MRYDFVDLKLFRAIAETSSLSAGAARIYLSPGSASYRLKNLEQALGTPLFLRTPKRMELTAAGQAMLQHAGEVFALIERMHGEMGVFASGMRGNVRLFANSSALNGFLPRDLASFLVANPLVNVEVEEHSSTDIVLSVGDSLADIGVVASDIEAGELRILPYAEDALIIAVPAEHPLAGRAAIDFEETLDHDFVAMSRLSSNFQFLLSTANQLGRHVRIRIQAPSFATVIDLVAAGVGIALVPRSVFAALQRPGACVAIPLIDPWAMRRLKILTRKTESMSPYIVRLVEHLLTGIHDSSVPRTGDRDIARR